jgi:histone-lysine N-methyltransferase SETD3
MLPQEQRLMAFMRAGGARFPAVVIGPDAFGGRGINAARDIAAGETIATIPLRCLITVRMGRETDIGRLVAPIAHELTDANHCFLSIFMTVDRARAEVRS